MKNDRETVIDVERDQSQYYAYTATGEFLAQGSSFRAMFDDIKQRFPGRSFRINRYNPTLTEEEAERMITALFDVFSEKTQQQSNQKT